MAYKHFALGAPGALGALGALAACLAQAVSAQAAVPPTIAMAIAAPSRPEADSKRDGERKPAETLMFAGVAPGDKVMDLLPGGGYFTRLFVETVGPTGHVYSVVPSELAKLPRASASIQAIKAYADAHPTDTVLIEPVSTPLAPEPLDIVFTAQNYHDLHDKFLGPADLVQFNKTVYQSLKPGGVFVVVDHRAPAGSGLAATETLHRIDPETVKLEVLAAGFVLEGEGVFLANPADPKDKLVFDPSIRGHTDQFVLKFRKPQS